MEQMSGNPNYMQNFTLDDTRYMQSALNLAWSVKGFTIPNPAVGAVLVKNRRIIGSGTTMKWGGSHAEKVAIRMAGNAARGSTLYVTLEPCCHYGKTPPCTDAIIAAGISKVIIALRDPNPRVAGKGIAQLKRNGITVATGLLREEAKTINEDFLWSIVHKQAFITLKLALTLDGRIADVNRHSKWITSAASRKIVHTLRGHHAAIAVGKGTLGTDNPRLTIRTRGKKTVPARIIFSSDKIISDNSYFFLHAHQTRSIIVVKRNCKQRIEHDPTNGIEYWFTGSGDPGESMNRFCSMAFENNLTSIFIEGGQKIASIVLEAGLVNRLHLFYGNHIVGKGIDGILTEHGYPLPTSITLKNRKSIILNNDIYTTGIPVFPPSRHKI